MIARQEYYDDSGNLIAVDEIDVPYALTSGPDLAALAQAILSSPSIDQTTKDAIVAALNPS